MELYRLAGVRSCEIGTLMRGEFSGPELVRLAIPRRVYTQSHIDYVLEALEILKQRASELRGFDIDWADHALRHFTVKLRPAG